MQIQNRTTSSGYVLNAIYMNSVLQKYFKHSAVITDISSHSITNMASVMISYTQARRSCVI